MWPFSSTDSQALLDPGLLPGGLAGGLYRGWPPQSRLYAARPLRSRRPVLDQERLPEAVACGLAQPAPDRLTPRRAAAAIWSWAPGHPHSADGNQVLPEPPRVSGRCAHRPLFGISQARASFHGAMPQGAHLLDCQVWEEEVACGSCLSMLPHEAHFDLIPEPKRHITACHVLPFRQCAAISAADGRWRALNCSAALPSACRARGSGEWLLTRPGSPGGCRGIRCGAGAPNGCEALTPGAAFELPRHAKENLALAEALRAARQGQVLVDAAWLPLTGDTVLVRNSGVCTVQHVQCSAPLSCTPEEVF